MLHRLIDILHSQFSYNQMMFLLTLFELAKSDWLKRTEVYKNISINDHSTNVSKFISDLVAMGMLEQKKEHNGLNQGDCYVRLTPEARNILVGAFKASRA